MDEREQNDPGEADDPGFEPSAEGSFDAEALRDMHRMLGEMLSGEPGSMGFDPASLAQAAGLPGDASALQALFSTLQQAMQHPQTEIDWSAARRIAIDVAGQHNDGASSGISEPSTSAQHGGSTQEPPLVTAATAERAFPVASLWLDEVTELGATADAPRAISAIEWVQQTMDTWIGLAEPVASAITSALKDTIQTQLPEEFRTASAGLAPILHSVGGALFATQLGQVIGKLSREVAAGGDVGIPLFAGEGREGGVLLPSGVAAFAQGLDQDAEAVTLYLAVRELAHARLFRHTRWLRLHLVTAIADYARGMQIPTLNFEDLAADFDPADPDAMQRLVSSGALIPPKTPEQESAHERLESMLALIEGWVDVVTEAAVSRLPGSEGIAEMVRRRRAVGGPAEHAFSTLVGLELRPRRMREAAAMWRLVAERGGIARRDGLWAHPDLLPTSEELDHPARLLERLGLAGAEPSAAPSDDIDRALAELLSAGLLERDAEQQAHRSDPDSERDTDTDTDTDR